MADEAFWNAKLARVARETFVTMSMPAQGVPATAQYAVVLSGWLRRQGTVELPTLGDLALAAGIPRKFISRALALLVRYRLVDFDTGPPVRVSVRSDSFARSKNSTPARRGPISKRERSYVYELDGHRCGRQFSASYLAVDHIVPLSFLGADEPGNWVTLCRQDNATKSDGFQSDYLRFFRGDAVRGTVGVRFAAGMFWPLINGRMQRTTRAEWSADE